MNKYEKIYQKAREQNARASWLETAIPALAIDLEEAIGETVKVSGPFGLRAELWLTAGNRFIRLTPDFSTGTLKLYYDTGETTNRFQPGTLGDRNGFNNVQTPLPDTLDEIVKLLRPTT